MYIHIKYSWGDEEEPVVVPENKDPWAYMKELAVNEAEESFNCNEQFGPIGLEFYKNERKIILSYNHDFFEPNEKCIYELKR